MSTNLCRETLVALALRDGAAVGGDDEPVGAEAVAGLTGRLAGLRVAGEVVERVAGVGHLERSVGALGGCEQRRLRAGPRERLAGRGQRRPGFSAAAGTGAGRALVGLPEVQRAALGIDEERAQVACRRFDGRGGGGLGGGGGGAGAMGAPAAG